MQSQASRSTTRIHHLRAPARSGSAPTTERRRPALDIERSAQYEQTFVSLSALHSALRHRDVDQAWAIMEALPHAPLRFVARVVALLAEENDPRYRPAADRFLVRVIEEVAPEDPVQIKKLADVLAHVHHYYWQHEAMAALSEVVGQLHERDVRLAIGFDSEGERLMRR